jgi:uncharacterized protein (TIGR02145 family)
MTRLKKKILLDLWVISLLWLTFCCESDNTNPFVQTPKEIGHTGQEGTIYDIDSNRYKIVGIGSQIWMAENLKVTRFNNGTSISNITDSIKWYWADDPGYCWYNNNSILNKQTYGGLYNYYAVETGLLCPVGWHVPDNNDWDVLIKYIGDRKIVGAKLKQVGFDLWKEPNSNPSPATDEYGFRAIPGGYRKLSYNIDAEFTGIGSLAMFWCFDASDKYFAAFKYLGSNSSALSSYIKQKRAGLSIRCILDNPKKR